MSRRVFDYNGITRIGFEGPKNLLERIAENLESEVSQDTAADCEIKINQAEYPTQIVKDKKFDYLTINKPEAAEQSSISYRRYNTHVRTIHQKSARDYMVDVNVELDEASGLICVRNYLSNHLLLSQYPLLHSSLLNLNGAGILIPGDARQGKTALSVYLLQEQGASFVSDENVILDTSGDIRGLYVPRTPRVRFSTIAESKLSRVLEDITIANATQYIDPDAIERIISARCFNVDAGIAFSRRAFRHLLGAGSQESSPIDVVLFPYYSETTSVRGTSYKEGIQRISKFGLIRKSEIDPKELEQTIVNLNQRKFKGIDFIEVGFPSINSLKQGGFKI
jgi:hypothetical protein